MFKEFWDGLGVAGRRGIGAGAVVILALTIALAWWTLRPRYDVLFSGLSPSDAAAMTDELDHLKIPYRLGADGSTILVDQALVPSTRLKLMSKDIPLHGAVGFELFNNTDFGMTEFAQKINYQRALQGELTRTILSFQEVESARVHIAFPEEGLFKANQEHAKSSVTLRMKPGLSLRPEQVAGIQRLVAASVTGLSPPDVTIVDEHGVALTRSAPGTDGATSGAELDLKRDIEQALARKATAMLDKAVGRGRALVSVDATLDMSQVRVTQEDVTHPAAADGEAPTGVVVRARESVRDDATAGASPPGTPPAPSNTQRETEYQVGRRVEQVIRQPGSIRRLQVVAVVEGGMPPQRIEEVRAVLSAAVGASADRGDQVLVQPMEAGLASGMGAPAVAVAAPAPGGLSPGRAPAGSGLAVPAAASRATDRAVLVAMVALIVAAVALAGWILSSRARRRVQARRVRTMSEAEREAALRRMRQWLAEDEPPVVPGVVVPGVADAR